MDYFEGGLDESGNISLTPYFFYHVPRCGGMTVKAAIQVSFQIFRQAQVGPTRSKLDELLCDRCDDTSALESNRVFKGRCLFLASHLPFGFHTKFVNQRFRFITILREPWARAQSAYFYKKMRSSTRPSPDDLAAFLDTEENCNIATKQLAGVRPDHPIGAEAFEQACQNLTSQFHAFGLVEDIPAIISDVLKENSFPNVVSERINPTYAKYRIACEESDRFKTLNEWDRRLYAFVKSNRRIPKRPQTNPHPYSAWLREVGDDSGTRSQAAVVPTNQFVHAVKNGKVPKGMLDQQEGQRRATGRRA